MQNDTPINIVHLGKWLTIIFLFFACACVFVHLRAAQDATKKRIVQWQHETASFRKQAEALNASIKIKLGPKTVETRLRRNASLLGIVAIEHTETLSSVRATVAK